MTTPSANAENTTKSEQADEGSRAPSSRFRPWTWGVLTIVVAALTMSGALSNTNVFYVRDLGTYWWPNHLWVHDTLLSGSLPLWNPAIGLGKPVLADASRQILFLPILPLRLLPPVLGFNLSIAFAFPVAAFGMYGFLRGHVSRPAASLGGMLYAVSGPILSNGNFLTTAWTMALVPWGLWSMDRLAERPGADRFACLALVFCLSVLAGEPMTAAGSGAVIAGYAVVVLSDTASWRRFVLPAALAVGAGLTGMLLAAVQFLPLLEAYGASPRAESTGRPTIWSLHPLMLAETVSPAVFGDPLGPWEVHRPWMYLLNSGQLPYVLSVYCGVAALTLCLCGVLSIRPRRWVVFWTIALGCSLLCALGYNTPFYPTLQKVFPFTGSFRFPSKFVYFSALSGSVLAATGWAGLAEALDRGGLRRQILPAVWASAALAATAAVAWLLAVASPDSLLGGFSRLASSVGLKDPPSAAGTLLESASSALPRLALLSAVTALLIWLAISALPGRRYAPWLLFALAVVDPFASNIHLNPTVNARLLGEPEWVSQTRGHPLDRTYVGGTITWAMGGHDEDDPPSDVRVPSGVSVIWIENVVTGMLGSTDPSPWGIREAVSHDVTELWPREYWIMLKRFKGAGQEERQRFLTRAGVRFHVTPSAPEGSRLIAPVRALEPMAVYEVPNPAARVSVVEKVRLDPNVGSQIFSLFDPAVDPASTITIGAEPAASGGSGPGLAPSADILQEAPDSLDVRADVPEGGGYLVVLDSYDPNWLAEVDGRPAPLIRADGLFRAVRLASGQHRVRMEYRSVALLNGMFVSSVTASILLAAILVQLRRSRR